MGSSPTQTLNWMGVSKERSNVLLVQTPFIWMVLSCGSWSSNEVMQTESKKKGFLICSKSMQDAIHGLFLPICVSTLPSFASLRQLTVKWFLRKRAHQKCVSVSSLPRDVFNWVTLFCSELSLSALIHTFWRKDSDSFWAILKIKKWASAAVFWQIMNPGWRQNKPEQNWTCVHTSFKQGEMGLHAFLKQLLLL